MIPTRITGPERVKAKLMQDSQPFFVSLGRSMNFFHHKEKTKMTEKHTQTALMSVTFVYLVLKLAKLSVLLNGRSMHFQPKSSASP